MRIVPNTHNPHFPVVGKEIPCAWCSTVFIPESNADITSVTHENDYLMKCPTCENVVWAYWGTDSQIHSGKWFGSEYSF